jgi:hypothetical protein
MSKPTVSERLSMGSRAEHELSITRKAFTQVRTALLEAIAATPFEHRDQREQLYLSVNMLPAIEDLLVAYVNDAAAAKAELDAAEIVTAAAERRSPQTA